MISSKRSIGSLFMAVGLGFMLSSATAAENSASSPANDGNYRLGKLDQIQITIFVNITGREITRLHS